MSDIEDPIAAYAKSALPILSDLVRRELEQVQKLIDLVGLASDGTGPLAAMGRQATILRRRNSGQLLDMWKAAMRSEEGVRELDDPGPTRLAVLVNLRGKGGMVFYFYDPASRSLVEHLDVTATADNVLMNRLLHAVNEGRPMAVRQFAQATATVTHIAATIWARLRLGVESFVEMTGQSYDQMLDMAQSELAQGRDPWQLAGIPELPEGAEGVPVRVELDYDPGVWFRVTDALSERGSAISTPNEVATLLMVAARLWVLCRFDRGALMNVVARRAYEQAVVDVANMPVPGQGDKQRPGTAPS